MSLDQLLKASKPSVQGVKESNIELFLPPEFNITLERWRQLFEYYNLSGRTTKTADTIQHYIRDKNPGESTNNLFSVSDVVEREGRFFVDATFLKTKTALTALYIYKAEKLKLMPITTADGSQPIVHIVLTYVPE